MTPAENARINQEEIDSCQVELRSMPIQLNIDLTGRCNINPPCVFCSYSNCAIGNVAQMKLEDIWNGREIVGIRKDLIAGRFPSFCREHGASCPLIARK